MERRTFTVTHCGPPNKPGTKIQKIKAYSPQYAMSLFKGRQMTKDEIAAQKGK